MSRYWQYWRLGLNFREGAYRLDFWWIRAVNVVLELMLLAIPVIFFQSWYWGFQSLAIFSVIKFVPDMALLTRRLRDTGLALNQIMFVILSPSLLWIGIQVVAEFGLIFLLPIVVLSYFGWFVFMVSRRSAYWTPQRNQKQKLAYGLGFVGLIMLTMTLTGYLMVAGQTTINCLIQPVLSDPKTATSGSAADTAASKSSSSGAAQHNTSAASSSVPEKPVTRQADDKQTTAYRELPAMTIGDASFGFMTVNGQWQQDPTTLQWWQLAQNIVIDTRDRGQGFGVDTASFAFKAISSQSHFQLTTQGDMSGTRYDGTYQSPTATKPDAMSYLEWRTPDHQLRAVYVIAPTIALRNLVVDQIIQSYHV